MSSGNTTRPSLRRDRLEALLGLGATLVAALTLEFLGWRIVHPGLSLAQAWGMPLLLGGLRTAGGAAAAGLVFVAVGFLIRRLRPRLRLSLGRLWCSGAAAYLLVMSALVAWAP